MEAHGVDTGYFGSTSELTSSEQSGALCDKKIDAFGYTVGVPNAVLRNQQMDVEQALLI